MIINRLNVARLFFSFAKHSQGAKPENNFQTFTSDLKNNKDVYAEYQKQVEKDTILRKFRRDVFKKEQISEQIKAYKQEMQKQSHMMQDLLHRGSKQDIIKYSKKIMEKLMNKKKLFKEQSLNPVFSDYGDYSSYRTNFVKIEDGKLGQLQRLDITTSTANVYKMLEELPDQYQEKDQIREQINQDYQHSNQNMSIADYGKVIQARLDREQHVTEGRIEYYDTYKEGINRLNRTEKTYYEEMLKQPSTREDLQTGANFKIGRLSPLAMDTIYESYLQGWSVRDISKRFGILPKRAKFVIWCRAQLYDELLPKYGWKFYFQGLQRELQMGEEDGFVDYGLDLDELRSSRLPEEIIQWNPNRVDAARKQQQYTLAMQKLEKLHKFDRHEKVQVGTHGKQNKMYYLKEWTIFRGKGSNKYFLENHTFRGLTKAKKKMVKEYY